MSVKEIAEKYGYTPQAIRDCLKLADASLDIKKVIENGQLAGYAALMLIKDGRNSKEQLRIFYEAKKKNRDGERVTVSDIKKALRKK